MKKTFYILITSNLLLSILHITSSQDLHISNLSSECFRCLCYVATHCNLTLGCDQGYCGPYKISRIYWIDGANVTLPGDEVERAGAYEDCALSYQCSQRIITNYLASFGKDCNSDGVTNCEDYMMINFNGGNSCQQSLQRNEAGRGWLHRYNSYCVRHTGARLQ